MPRLIPEEMKQAKKDIEDYDRTFNLNEKDIDKIADEVIEDFKAISIHSYGNGFYIGRNKIGLLRYLIDKAIKRSGETKIK